MKTFKEKLTEAAKAVDPEKIKTAFKKEIKAAAGPIHIDGFSFDSHKSWREFLVLYDTPRDYRHPDEYMGGWDALQQDSEYQKFMKADNKIHKVIAKFKTKYKKYKFGSAADTSNGPTIERF